MRVVLRRKGCLRLGSLAIPRIRALARLLFLPIVDLHLSPEARSADGIRLREVRIIVLGMRDKFVAN